MGPTFFKHLPKPGRPLSMPGLALGLARLEHAFKNLTVHNGRVDWHGHEPKIILDNADELHEAQLIVFVNGKPYVSSNFPMWATPAGAGTIASWPSDGDFGYVASEKKAVWVMAALSTSGDYSHTVTFDSGTTFPAFSDTTPAPLNVWRPIAYWDGYTETRLSIGCISIFVP